MPPLQAWMKVKPQLKLLSGQPAVTGDNIKTFLWGKVHIQMSVCFASKSNHYFLQVRDQSLPQAMKLKCLAVLF